MKKFKQKIRKVGVVCLTLVMALTLMPEFTIPVVWAAAAHPASAIETALAGNGYGANGKFLAPIDQYASGSYAIDSAEELQKIGQEGGLPAGADYHLTADIDLDNIAWEPLEGFYGTFDGQGRVIRNLTVSGDCEYAGLFATVSGTHFNTSGTEVENTPVFKNIGIEDINIDVNDAFAGGLLAYKRRGNVIISNCYSTGKVKNTKVGAGDRVTGGLVGKSYGSNPTGTLNMSDCYNAAEVTTVATSYDEYDDYYGDIKEAGLARTGGLVGEVQDAETIDNCHNIGTITSDATGASAAGGLVGRFSYSTAEISNCSNTGTVTALSANEFGVNEEPETDDYASRSNAGGIIGMRPTSSTAVLTIISCYNAGDISAEMATPHTEAEIFAGGIGGHLHGQILSDCYNTGAVTAFNSDDSNGYAGGITGRNSANSSVRRCYNTGSVTGAKPGAIVGLALPDSITRSDSFYLIGSAGKGIAEIKNNDTSADSTTVLTSSRMKQEITFTSFNFTQSWGFKIGENDGYPILQAFYPGWSYTPSQSVPGPSRAFLAPIEEPKEGSIPIGSVEDLMKIGGDYPLSQDYHLTADLNLTGINWEPIGDDDNNFRGTFDGQGHVIHNLEIVGAYAYAGLFGRIGGSVYTGGTFVATNPVIKNLALENAYVHVTKRGTSTFGTYIGGLVGQNNNANATISNCYITGEVTGAASDASGANVGGIIGYNEATQRGSLNIADCYNGAAVTAHCPNSSGSTYAGGIMGCAAYTETVSNCHNAGKITATTTYGNCIAGGIVAGLGGNQSITGCSNKGDVTSISTGTGYDSWTIGAGGIVGAHLATGGFDKRNILTACWNTGDITAQSTVSSTQKKVFAGGIGGYMSQQSLSDSYNTGNIAALSPDGVNGYAGGIVGRVAPDSNVRRSYSTGNVSAGPHQGGIAGLAEENSFIKDCFWNSDAIQTQNSTQVAQSSKKGVGSGEDTTVSLTAEQMKQEVSYANIFSLTQIWGFKSGENNGYPVLRAYYKGLNYTPTIPLPEPKREFLITEFAPPPEGSIPISTREELDNIRNDMAGTYHLINDIDLTGVDWTPIGTNTGSNPFTGVFDGQGYVITGMTVIGYVHENLRSAYTGLFHYVSGSASVRNVGLEDICVRTTNSADYYTGGLIGYLAGGTVSNCYVTGQVAGGVVGSTGNFNYTGGITGVMGSSNPVIQDCYNAADVIGGTKSAYASRYVGGITGRLTSGRIVNCHNTGTITGVYYDLRVGGIAGALTNAEAACCSNTGKVTVDANSSTVYAGGIVGENSGSVNISYNTGSVTLSTTSTASSLYLDGGGIVGYNNGSNGKVNDCYNRGDIKVMQNSSAYTGGIVGYGYNNSGVARSYSTGNLSGSNMGGVAGFVAATSTLTDTFWNKESTQTMGSTVLPSGKGIGINNSTTATTTGLTAAQMKLKDSFTGFDFDTTWSVISGENDGYPVLRKKFLVTALRGTGSSANGTGGGLYAAGETVTIKAGAANSTYRFKEWTATSDIVFANKNSAETTFVMPARSVTVTATYELIPIRTVTVINGTSGSSGGTSSTCTWYEGSRATIKANTIEGKRFKEWVTDGEDVVFDNPTDKTNNYTSFIMPARDTTITATYEDIDYTVTVNGGTAKVNETPVTTATIGTQVTITANPPEGKYFVKWTTSTAGVVLENAESAETTFTMPARNASVTATYANVVKESQETPSAPECESVTDTEITLVTVPGAEYRRGTSGTWQDSPIFRDLTPNTNYTFYIRMKETETHYASNISPSLSVRTDPITKQEQTAPSAPTVQSKTTSRVTLNTITGAEYRKDNGPWQSSPIFSGLTQNTAYLFYVRLKETSTHNASPASEPLSVQTNININTQTYTVTFKNGSTVLKIQSGIKHGSSAAAPPNPTKKGYIFSGWDKGFNNVTASLTVSAKWTAIAGKITPVSKTVKKGKILKLTAGGNAAIKSVKWTTSKKAYVKIKSGAGKKTVTIQGVKKGKKATIKAVITFMDGTKKTVKRTITVK